MCLYLLYLRLFPPTTQLELLSEFAKKILHTCPSIGKCYKCLETNILHFVLTLFHPKKAMRQSPCFDIEYWRSYGPFLFIRIAVEQNTKYLHRIAVTFLISMAFNHIINRLFRLLVCLYPSSNRWGLCCWNPPLSSSLFFRTFSFDTVVIHLLIPG